MGFASRLYNFLAHQTIKSNETNEELNQILALLNGGIENNNVKMGAGIRQDEGKLILDYDAIRTALYTDVLNWLDGGALLDDSVPLGKMEYEDDSLVAAGIYTNTNPGSFPWTVPANTFKNYLMVEWGCEMDTPASPTHPSNATPRATIGVKIDGQFVPNAINGLYTIQYASEQDGAGRQHKFVLFGTTYVKMSSGNNYTGNPPELDRTQQHTFDIDIESKDAGEAGDGNFITLSKKNMVLLGR